MEKVKKILVLGSSGMLGHILVTTIKSKKISNYQILQEKKQYIMIQ